MALIDDFKKIYPTKYSFQADETLDNGAYGTVYKVYDNDRKIHVAIRLLNQ